MPKEQSSSEVISFQFDGELSDFKQTTLKSDNVENLSIKKTLATGVICSMIVFGGMSTPPTNQVISNIPIPPKVDRTVNGSSWTNLGRRSEVNEEFISFTYTGTKVDNFVTIPDKSAYAIEGANENWEAKEMLQKLMVKRDGLEKQGMYTGVILAVLILLIPLMFKTVSWSAVVPSAILSLSLTGFMLMRRHSRR